MKEGNHPQHVTLETEIWKGRYNNEVVALKILRVPRDDPQIQKVKSVSVPRDSPGEDYPPLF